MHEAQPIHDLRPGCRCDQRRQAASTYGQWVHRNEGREFNVTASSILGGQALVETKVTVFAIRAIAEQLGIVLNDEQRELWLAVEKAKQARVVDRCARALVGRRLYELDVVAEDCGY